MSRRRRAPTRRRPRAAKKKPSGAKKAAAKPAAKKPAAKKPAPKKKHGRRRPRQIEAAAEDRRRDRRPSVADVIEAEIIAETPAAISTDEDRGASSRAELADEEEQELSAIYGDDLAAPATRAHRVSRIADARRGPADDAGDQRARRAQEPLAGPPRAAQAPPRRAPSSAASGRRPAPDGRAARGAPAGRRPRRTATAARKAISRDEPAASDRSPPQQRRSSITGVAPRSSCRPHGQRPRRTTALAPRRHAARRCRGRPCSRSCATASRCRSASSPR